MPHTEETRKRAYGKMRTARERWFQENGPCRQCGSSERLELDHVDPAQKVGHTVWSWKPARRAAELKKCQVLCHDCHRKKTAGHLSATARGRIVEKLRKISDKEVLKAVLMRESGCTVRAIAIKFKVSHATIVRLTKAAMAGKQFHSRGVLLRGER